VYSDLDGPDEYFRLFRAMITGEVTKPTRASREESASGNALLLGGSWVAMVTAAIVLYSHPDARAR
jgi:hypothetical protein